MVLPKQARQPSVTKGQMTSSICSEAIGVAANFAEQPLRTGKNALNLEWYREISQLIFRC
jgi:hypothetical protein